MAALGRGSIPPLPRTKNLHPGATRVHRLHAARTSFCPPSERRILVTVIFPLLCIKKLLTAVALKARFTGSMLLPFHAQSSFVFPSCCHITNKVENQALLRHSTCLGLAWAEGKYTRTLLWRKKGAYKNGTGFWLLGMGQSKKMGQRVSFATAERSNGND